MVNLTWKDVARDPGAGSMISLYVRHYIQMAAQLQSISMAHDKLMSSIKDHPRKNITPMWQSYSAEIKDDKIEIYKLFPGSADKAPKLIYLIEERKEVAHG